MDGRTGRRKLLRHVVITAALPRSASALFPPERQIGDLLTPLRSPIKAVSPRLRPPSSVSVAKVRRASLVKQSRICRRKQDEEEALPQKKVHGFRRQWPITRSRRYHALPVRHAWEQPHTCLKDPTLVAPKCGPYMRLVGGLGYKGNERPCYAKRRGPLHDA